MADANLSQIEARVAEDRAALARSLDMMTSALAPDQLKGAAAGYGREISGQLWGAARENPAAFALVGAGLALILTNVARRPDDAAQQSAPHGSERPGPAAVPPQEAMAGFDQRLAAADQKLRDASETQSEFRASQLREALNKGLEKLPPSARARVLDARRRAITAQESVERQAARATAKAQRIASDQPVATAAAAFGVGALFAALLPSTSREDALMGAERDRLMNEARSALAREVDALRGASAAGAAPPERPRAAS